MKPIIILGGNLSALAAAYELSRSETGPIYVIDNRPELGGLARTCTHEGFRFDLGPHRLSRSAAGATYSFLEALLGGALVQVPVRTACVLNGRLWDAQTLDM